MLAIPCRYHIDPCLIVIEQSVKNKGRDGSPSPNIKTPATTTTATSIHTLPGSALKGIFATTHSRSNDQSSAHNSLSSSITFHSPVPVVLS